MIFSKIANAARKNLIEPFFDDSLGALGGIIKSTPASKAVKADLDPLGYQNTRMNDVYLSDTDVRLSDTDKNLGIGKSLKIKLFCHFTEIGLQET